MQVPLLTRDLALQLEAAEAACLRAKLLALMADDGNAHGAETACLVAPFCSRSKAVATIHRTTTSYALPKRMRGTWTTSYDGCARRACNSGSTWSPLC